MKTFLASIVTAAALMAGAAPLAAETRAEKAETRVAEMLEGRTAGEPRNCITALNSSDLRVLEHVGIVYERGDTIWLARASDPRQLGISDVPIFDRFGSQLCRTDVIRTVDRGSGFFTGSVFLEPFVPYTRTAEG